jgi:hypothetical protein
MANVCVNPVLRLNHDAIPVEGGVANQQEVTENMSAPVMSRSGV